MNLAKLRVLLLLAATLPLTRAAAEKAKPGPSAKPGPAAAAVESQPKPEPPKKEQGWGRRIWTSFQDVFASSEGATENMMSRGIEALVPEWPKGGGIREGDLEFRWRTDDIAYQPKKLHIVVFNDEKYERTFEVDGSATSFRPPPGQFPLVPGHTYNWVIEGQATPIKKDGYLSKPMAFRNDGKPDPSPAPAPPSASPGGK